MTLITSISSEVVREKKGFKKWQLSEIKSKVDKQMNLVSKLMFHHHNKQIKEEKLNKNKTDGRMDIFNNRVASLLKII